MSTEHGDEQVTVNKEVIRGWRKLHDEELRNLHSTPDIIKAIKTR